MTSFAKPLRELGSIGVAAAPTGGQGLALDERARVPLESGGMPTGVFLPYGGSTAPTGWLLCDGSAVSRETYMYLFGVIGTSYGVGDSSTTFNLPDFRGRVPAGRDAGQTEFDVLGETGGAKTHTLAIGEIPNHDHGGGSHEHGPDAAAFAITNNIAQVASGTDFAAVNAAHSTTAHASGVTAQGGGGAHNNLQPYQVVNYIVKT